VQAAACSVLQVDSVQGSVTCKRDVRVWRNSPPANGSLRPGTERPGLFRAWRQQSRRKLSDLTSSPMAYEACISGELCLRKRFDHVLSLLCGVSTGHCQAACVRLLIADRHTPSMDCSAPRSLLVCGGIGISGRHCHETWKSAIETPGTSFSCYLP